MDHSTKRRRFDNEESDLPEIRVTAARPLRRRRETASSQTVATTSAAPSPEDALDPFTRPGRPLRKRPTDGSRRLTPKAVILPPTPPTSAEDDNSLDILSRATHVLATEAAALADVSRLYQTSAATRASLVAAVESIVSAQRRPNSKVIFCGVGKSAYIAQKLTATCKSLSIKASFLHACEALHGDLGDLRPRDVICFVSFSGSTPELVALLPHLPDHITVVALTGKTKVENCRLLDGRQDGILLSAPIRESEESTFGVSAPTTSTTIALAVGDMLVLTVAEGLHAEKKRALFLRNHPGGAIGLQAPVVVEEFSIEQELDLQPAQLCSPSVSPQAET